MMYVYTYIGVNHSQQCRGVMLRKVTFSTSCDRFDYNVHMCEHMNT